MTGDLPDLPYAGGSGSSGSDTSREREQRDDRDGTTSERQSLVLRLLAGEWVDSPDGTTTHKVDPLLGVTWKELSTVTGWHHGQASGVLSVLHKTGRIARLAAREARRHRCAPYVLPEYVHDRQTAPQGRTDPDSAEVRIIRALAVLDEADDYMMSRDLRARLRATLTDDKE